MSMYIYRKVYTYIFWVHIRYEIQTVLGTFLKQFIFKLLMMVEATECKDAYGWR